MLGRAPKRGQHTLEFVFHGVDLESGLTDSEGEDRQQSPWQQPTDLS